ncbi:MAG: hypothetical protein WAO61_07345 [Solirubrobacterales bacterium]
MGNSALNRARTLPSRAVTIALAICVISVGLVASAVGGDNDRPAAKPKSDASADAVARIVRAVREPGSARLSMSKALLGKSDHESRPRKPRGPKPRIFAAVTDWPHLYFVRSKTSLDSERTFENGTTPLTLVRKDLTSGAETRLLRIRGATVNALRAGGGRAMVSLVRTSESRGNTRINTRIVAFEAGSTAAKTISVVTGSSPTGNDLFDDKLCGRIAVLAGVADTGEAIVNRLTGTCSADGQHTYALETVAIGLDGAVRVLQINNTQLYLIAFGRATLTGTRLLQSAPFLQSVTQVDTATASLSRLWNGDFAATVAQAADGTVAVAGTYLATLAGESGDLFEVDSGDDYDQRDATPDPFVLFPLGDRDQPIEIAPGLPGRLALHYCGASLYELQATRKVELDGISALLSLVNGGLPRAGKIRVNLRDARGALIREVAITDGAWVRDIACDGETLVLATSSGATSSATRYGP